MKTKAVSEAVGIHEPEQGVTVLRGIPNALGITPKNSR